MINKESSEMIEQAERHLDEAIYKFDNKSPRIWDVNFVIAITLTLITIAKELHKMNTRNP